MTRKLKAVSLGLLTLGLMACESIELRKSDAELGLNAVQSAGRQIYDRKCDECHEPYRSKTKKGPSLAGIYKRPYLRMGAPANDDRVREIITLGHNKMPAYARVLTPDQIDLVIAYLHTL